MRAGLIRSQQHVLSRGPLGTTDVMEMARFLFQVAAHEDADAAAQQAQWDQLLTQRLLG